MAIYFIQSDDLIKIGFSEQVKNRVASIICGLRNGGEYLGHMPGGRDVERHLHSKFAALREYGEWFRADQTLREFVTAIADQAYPQTGSSFGEISRLQEDVFAEQAAESLRDFIITSKSTRPEAMTKISVWSGIGIDRLGDILDGNVSRLTAGELAVCMALGEASACNSISKLAARGIEPPARLADRSRAQR